MAASTDARAVLFDVDGTLVDSNYVHVESWQRAFQELETDVDDWRIHRAIGLDSQRLITSLVGEREPAWITRAKHLHKTYFLTARFRLRAFRDARALMRALHDDGVTVVLATSAPQDELAVLRSVLDADGVIDAATSADDVDSAKPDPDIFEVALTRARVGSEQAIVIGDATWDFVAAGRAGIAGYGVRCGGTPDADLLDAGARDVFDDPADLLRNRDRLRWG
jgi:HAD superfamily hydrolase (TIGR01509 family)